MGKINFIQEIRDHVIWNIRLRCFLDGGECIQEEEAVSPHECSLGKWLYTEGIQKYGMISEMQELEKAHAKLHVIVRRVIQLSDSGDNYTANSELAKLELISNKVVDLIMAVENGISIADEQSAV
ncbi:MAG: CZB domain-containing protein [Candidatus Omnitrophica bacterium]|nr:CZB domain-containing protein [Candidatus Omnitrophota bacterium]